MWGLQDAVKALALKDYQENRVTYQENHPWLPTKYTNLCIEPILYSDSHDIIGKHIYQAKPWTLGPVSYC